MPNISRKKIRPELRHIGTLIRLVLPYFKVSTFRKANWIQDRFMKGKWRGKRTKCAFSTIKRGDGSDLRILICEPKEKREGVPGLLWMHGGGYAIGLPEQDASFIESFILRSSCVVIAPDYRCSAKAPYPAALDDCYLTLKWMKAHAAQYGIRDDQLFVGGDSAGGGLTAALAILARDKREVSLAFQMPLYPMLDDRMTPSSRNNDAPVWNTKSNKSGWKLYLRNRYGTDHVPVYAAPARATNFKGLPPACSFVGGIEPFHDETVIYMKHLKKAGIPVHFREFPGCFHGFDFIAPKTAVAKEARRFLLDTFAYACQHYFAKQTDLEDGKR